MFHDYLLYSSSTLRKWPDIHLHRQSDSDEDKDNASEPDDDMHPEEVLKVLNSLYDRLYTLEKSPPEQQTPRRTQDGAQEQPTWRKFRERVTVYDDAAEELIRYNVVPKLKKLMGRLVSPFDILGGFHGM